MDATNLTNEELLALSESVTRELHRRGLAPPRPLSLGDLAEALVVERLGLQRAPKSTAGYDAIADDGTRYQIKARRLGTQGERQLGIIRNIDRRDFHYLIVVLFPPESDVPEGMWQLPFDFVLEKARYNKHQNGHVLFVTDAVLADRRVEWLLETPRPGSASSPPPPGDGQPGGSRGERVGGLESMEGFRSWLVNDKLYSERVASNAVSRCRRVERDLSLSLDASVSIEAGLAGVIDRIGQEILADATEKSRREGQASLISATRRYAEFLEGRLGTDPVDPSTVA